MASMVNYRSVMWWLLTAAYAVGIVLLHREVNQMAGRLQQFLGLSPYLFSMRFLGAIGILISVVVLAGNLYGNPTRLKKLLIFVPLALILDLSLISVPVERIHYFQYGFLTWIAYKAIGKQFSAALLVFAASVFDEAYQYWVLYADDRVVYFDWNDLVLNLIGILAVLLFLLPIRETAGKIPKKPVAAAIAIWTLAVCLTVFVFNPDRYLFRDDPYKGAASFWIKSNIKTNYHVMNTLEGLIFLGIISILTLGYIPPWNPASSSSKDEAEVVTFGK